MQFSGNRDKLVADIEKTLHAFIASKNIELHNSEKVRERITDCVDEILLFQTSTPWVS